MSEVFLAKIISNVFNPFIVWTIGLFVGTFDLIIKHDPAGYVCFLILTTTLPAYFYIVAIFKKLGDTGREDLTLLREDRDSIYLAAVFSMLFTVVILLNFNMNTFWVYNAMLGTVFFAVIYFINKFIDKISLHTATYGFTVVYIANATSLYWLLALVFLPLIAQSRLILKKHTKLQLGLGIAVGMFIGLLSWTFI